jgi:hypothetical protein
MPAFLQSPLIALPYASLSLPSRLSEDHPPQAATSHHLSLNLIQSIACYNSQDSMGPVSGNTELTEHTHGSWGTSSADHGNPEIQQKRPAFIKNVKELGLLIGIEDTRPVLLIDQKSGRGVGDIPRLATDSQ